jgi:hypothetical protein
VGIGVCDGHGLPGCLRVPDMPAYIYHPIPASTTFFSSITDILFQTIPFTLPDFTTQPLLNHYHYHHQQDHHTNTTMSSPAAQYVYIPNLVGRQMLRIPLEDVEVDDMVSYTPASSQTTSTTSCPSPPPFARTASRSPSISSVESTE